MIFLFNRFQYCKLLWLVQFWCRMNDGELPPPPPKNNENLLLFICICSFATWNFLWGNSLLWNRHEKLINLVIYWSQSNALIGFLLLLSTRTLILSPDVSVLLSRRQVEECKGNIHVYCCCYCFGGGVYQHCSHEGLLYSKPRNGVPSFISRGAAHQAAWERPLLAKDGTKAKEFS
jgi:hypothetical protein